ncbi:hypothetical protein BC828DRAFT_416523 [Blastocladiella britannica]|nr:hypothetical protein BC828DRAFT_416523 [Blastocladiella britannica]
MPPATAYRPPPSPAGGMTFGSGAMPLHSRMLSPKRPPQAASSAQSMVVVSDLDRTTLPLPLGTVEAVTAFFEDAMNQLDILDSIATAAAAAQAAAATNGASFNHSSSAPSAPGGSNSGGHGGRRASRSAASTRNGNGGGDPSSSISGGSNGVGSNNSSSSSAHETAARTAAQRRAMHDLLGTVAAELRQGHVTSLARAVDEEQRNRNLLADMIEKEKHTQANLHQLNQQLAAEKSSHARDAADRDAVISQLREATQEILALTASEQRYLKRATRAHEQAARAQYVHRESALLLLKAELDASLEVETRAHALAADHLHRQRGMLDRAIQGWMTKHEEDTEKLAGAIETLKSTRVADVDRYEELVAKFEELERAVEAENAQRQKQVDDRKSVREQERRARAARSIQRWWRARMLKIHPERAAAAARSASASKKGGSAGGKKGSAGKAKSGAKKGKK